MLRPLPAAVGIAAHFFSARGAASLRLSVVAVAQEYVGWPFWRVVSRDELTIFGALASWAGRFWVADVLALALVGCGCRMTSVLRPRWSVLREQIRYGAKGQIANMAALLNYRLDQFWWRRGCRELA